MKDAKRCPWCLKSEVYMRYHDDEWEKNVAPVIVEEQCLIRAEFHKIGKKYPYEIIITPKMSFGTGHHQTTYLMVKNQLEIDHHDRLVMDAGCGTAILSMKFSRRQQFGQIMLIKST